MFITSHVYYRTVSFLVHCLATCFHLDTFPSFPPFANIFLSLLFNVKLIHESFQSQTNFFQYPVFHLDQHFFTITTVISCTQLASFHRSQNHRVTEVERDLWRSSSPTPLLKTRSSTAGCSGLGPVKV